MGMTMMFSRLSGLTAGAVLAIGVVASAMAQPAAPAAAPAAAPGAAPAAAPAGYPQAGTDSNAAGPAGATRALEVPILYVTGIEVLHMTLDPKLTIVRVTGVTSSAG